VAAGVRRLRRSQTRKRRADRRLHVREVPGHVAETPRRDHQQIQLQTREVLGLHEGRKGRPQGDPRPGLSQCP
jgi:hypothetical protein